LQKRLSDLRRAVGAGVATAVRAAREVSGGEAGDLAAGFVRANKGDAAAEKRALSMLLVIRGLGHAATTPALRELVTMTEPFEGAYKNEIAKIFKGLGEAPIPALLEARRAAPETRKWAQAQLEALGKKTAGDAAQVKSTDVLCDIMRAWAATKDPEAVSVVLTLVNSDRIPVRTAAREALAAYGQEAIWKLRETYLNITGKPATDGWSAEQTAKELFAAFDRVRLNEVYEPRLKPSTRCWPASRCSNGVVKWLQLTCNTRIPLMRTNPQKRSQPIGAPGTWTRPLTGLRSSRAQS
jgi:hypothetical protein